MKNKIEPLISLQEHIGKAWEGLEKDRKSGMYVDDEHKIQAALDEYVARLGDKVNEIIKHTNSN